MEWRAVLAAAQRAPVPVDALTAALRERWPAVVVEDTVLLEGGLSSVLHRVRLRGAPVAATVLRQVLTEFGHDADTVRREAFVHRELPPLGLRVPRCRWSDPSGEVLGRPALLIDEVPGTVLLPDLVGSSGIDALAGVLARTATAPTVGLAALSHLADVEAHVHRFGPPPPSELVDSERIETAIVERSRWFVPRRQLVHADLHAGNVLWDGTEVTGVLDWPGAALGVALFDEAYAWLDTALAHGRPVADALQAAVDGARRGPSPSGGERSLWRACALHRALPTPAPWAEAYRIMGVDLTDEQVEERFVALVEDELAKG